VELRDLTLTSEDSRRYLVPPRLVRYGLNVATVSHCCWHIVSERSDSLSVLLLERLGMLVLLAVSSGHRVLTVRDLLATHLN